MTPDGTVSPPSRPRGRWSFVLIPLVLALAGVGWWALGGGGAARESVPEDPSAGSPAPRATSDLPGRMAREELAPGKGPPAPAALSASPETEEREARRQLWEKRLDRAKRTLESYMASTRYPPESRPGREHPDQMELAEPERTRPLGGKDSSDDTSDVQLRMKQDRVFVVGDEAVTFTVACEDERRTPRPCQVVSAVAHEAEHMVGAGGAPGVPVAFGDDGVNGDARAGDGTLTGRFQPSKQGFPMFSGTLRVDVRVRSGQVEDATFFDVLYTPAPPATFTRKVREVVEQGSLQLYLGIQVRKAGRYVVSGRVDDESGVPFAYVSFNEELPEGAHEVKLTVFGKLIIDEAPTFPLQLRDVDGFLLKESGDPDRELMATLRGSVHTSRAYEPSAFSPAEWQSEERSRYINELTKDVNEAQAQVDATVAGKTPP